MNELKILLVEDDDSQIRDFEDAVKDFNNNDIDGFNTENYKITSEKAKSLSEAQKLISNPFDGAIIDLKLEGDFEDNYSGNKIVTKIKDSFCRIPVFILTGTPGQFNDILGSFVLKTLKRGEEGSSYADLLQNFLSVYKTGLTNLMSGRGVFEQNLTKVFSTNILPFIQEWKEYGEKDTNRTEKALLRYTLENLYQLIDTNDENYFPEEVYLSPPPNNNYQTGSIVKSKINTSQNFVIVTPACDLVIRGNGSFKTDRILLIEIEDGKKIVDEELGDTKNKEKKEKKATELFKNNSKLFYHHLPKAYMFEGGFLNFRKLTCITQDELANGYTEPYLQVSSFFVKNILSRFSSYYARQGQPDIDFENLITEYTQER